MSTTPQRNDDNQEIDLSQISKQIGSFLENIITTIFKGILFLKRNIIIIGVLFVIGAVLGLYMDKNTKAYDNQIIVSPNFGATDYLYAKVDLISSKINENDTVFLKEVVGIKEPNKLKNVTIEPITDVYKFISNNTSNFELIKLLAEDGDINKILKDNMTSKNYPYHIISFTTDKMTSEANTVQPLLNYLNQSDYYSTVQKEYVSNIKLKMVQNDTIINQIDGFLKGFSNTVNGSQKSDKLVYYNENSQLNDVIKTKDLLISEQGVHRLELLNLDKIIKDNSATINIKNTKGTTGKMKLIVPFIFIAFFIFGALLRSFYKNQMSKMTK
jgi:uncharacterized protein YfkK (UPF0435 family)